MATLITKWNELILANKYNYLFTYAEVLEQTREHVAGGVPVGLGLDEVLLGGGHVA